MTTKQMVKGQTNMHRALKVAHSPYHIPQLIYFLQYGMVMILGLCAAKVIPADYENSHFVFVSTVILIALASAYLIDRQLSQKCLTMKTHILTFRMYMRLALFLFLFTIFVFTPTAYFPFELAVILLLILSLGYSIIQIHYQAQPSAWLIIQPSYSNKDLIKTTPLELSKAALQFKDDSKMERSAGQCLYPAINRINIDNQKCKCYDGLLQ